MKPRVIIHLECDSVLREPKVVKALEDLGIEITGTAYNPTSKVDVTIQKELTIEIAQKKIESMFKGVETQKVANILSYIAAELRFDKRAKL